jgi:lipid-A-disaccharide synthase
MAEPQKLLMIVAGEVSGDMRAGEVARLIRTSAPHIEMTGVGGENMRAAGVQCFGDITELAVIGFSDVIKNYTRLKKVFNTILAEVDRRKPDAVMLVDYPGFNLRLAKELKDRKIKVIYYISPQVWAWRENRIETIKKVVDKMLVLFAFEQAFYKKHHMDVDYVGHPLVDQVKTNERPEDVCNRLGLKIHLPMIGLLPGSREKEIIRHLPVMVKAAEILYKTNAQRQFIMLKAPTVSDGLIRSFTDGAECPIRIVEQNSYNEFNAFSACMIASGTATLEAAILKKPMVIIYKTSWATYQLAKFFIKIPHIGLANIVAGHLVVPELIQDEATPKNIAQEMEKLLTDNKLINRIQKEFAKFSIWLGEPGASQRTANILIKEIGSSLTNA